MFEEPPKLWKSGILNLLKRCVPKVPQDRPNSRKSCLRDRYLLENMKWNVGHMGSTGTHTRSAFLRGLPVDQQVWYRMRSAPQLPPRSRRSTKSNRGGLNPIEGAPLKFIFSFVFPLFQIQGDYRAKTQQLALIVSSSPTLLGRSHQKQKLY